jgi:hypothetical protein
MNYGEEELLDDNIINPIPILQSSLLDHQSTLGHQGTTIAKFPPSFSFSTPAFVSMAAIVTSHTPYSYWPPSGATTNENHYFM